MGRIGATDLTDVGDYQGTKVETQLLASVHFDDGTLYVHRAYEDIQRAMTTGSATRIDASEALRGLEIIMGIYESARLHRMLELPITQEMFPLEAGKDVTRACGFEGLAGAHLRFGVPAGQTR
jgi:hypothetical protein